MFTRKPKTTTSQVDELNRKKLAAKVLDTKKDMTSRLRYLKTYIESTDNVTELKQFFDQNYSQIFFIFYESFIAVEANIKHRLNKQNKDELDSVLFVLLVKKKQTQLHYFICKWHSFFSRLENPIITTGKIAFTMASEKHRSHHSKAHSYWQHKNDKILWHTSLSHLVSNTQHK